MKTFTVAGTSELNGIIKTRFANDLAGRIKVLERNGHKNIQLFALPEAMTKEDAIRYLATLDLDNKDLHKIEAAAKPKAPARVVKRPAKTTAKKAASKTDDTASADITVERVDAALSKLELELA